MSKVVKSLWLIVAFVGIFGSITDYFPSEVAQTRLQVELNFFHQREARAVDFLCFLRQKESEKWEAKDFEKV